MWSGVLVSIICLLSTLHSGASFYFLLHQERIETLYVTSRDVQEDWACALPTETKTAICKELLASHFFSKILRLDYNKRYERNGHKFECERRPLWLVSKEHVRTKRFRGFQPMIMCPACSERSNTCYVANGEEGVDRQIFTRRTFDNDKKKAKMSFEEMVESRDTFDFESREYLDADDVFAGSQQTHFTDATERFHSSQQMSSSVEQFDSEQRESSRPARNSRQLENSSQRANSSQRSRRSRRRVLAGGSAAATGRRADASDRSNSASGYPFDGEQTFDVGQRVIPEESAVDVDQLVDASRLGPEVDTRTRHVEKSADTKRLAGDRPDNSGTRVASSPNDGAEGRVVVVAAAERTIESPVRTAGEQNEENERSVVGEPVVIVERELSPDRFRRRVDVGHSVRSAPRPNDRVQPSGSDREVSLDLERVRNDAGRSRGAEEETDGSQNLTPERPVVAEIIAAGEEDADADRLVDVGRTGDAPPEADSPTKFDGERPSSASRKSGSAAAGSADPQRGAPPNNAAEQESRRRDEKEEAGRSGEAFLQKVDSVQDASRYANPGEQLEEYYFSVDPRRPQSIFLYTWFETGGYFTLYMHVIKLQTPILKPQLPAPKDVRPFDMWSGPPLHARPIKPYEPYEFLDEIENNKVPSLVKSSNKLIEMTRFAGGD